MTVVVSSSGFHLLVVCTANVCRSPAAEQFFEAKLRQSGVVVDSAGTLALDGNPADETIRRLMLERGFPEIAEHRSRALMPSHTSRYQLILCMERDHMARVQSLNPSAFGRIKLLGHWDGQSEVDDPIGRSQATYESSLDRMDLLTTQWADKLKEMGFI